ncbi:anaerobic ribonucleoside triphosphate reductase [Desulfovibrio sp. PG-178-WT-4]|uniref:Anaerobic ribonucleoside triphosphate reductase n=1 Tax=Desulfovibrio porci TaxID=2605782 RepID=A0A6L5XHG8_9BACT|nr:anaerobic ribonucleoside triphosphate reductase [Desulfovibrio porci]MDY3809044.1 anaerobic ribonucleoside triphosphate reductase [Desulfovibrio porci]MSS26606.1 anaerobic ribonucleoside triphosphate reductase [Desulfovibrio porci]
MPATIIKRDGASVPFDSVKILNAITKANQAVGGEDMSPTDLLFVTEKVCKKLDERNLCSVEEIQDVVEESLIQYDYAKTAKAYILYRAEHAKMRNAESYLMDIYKKLTYSPAIREDIKRENANIDGDTAMGTMLKYGSEGSKFFIDNYILPKDASAAHGNGDIHIHDKDFYMLTETCCQIDLIPLFRNGFSTGHGYLREPNSIESYSALACIAIQANQNEMHGGQSVPHFDFAMAPGVAKTYAKEYRKAFCACLRIAGGLDAASAETLAGELLEAAGLSPAVAIDEAGAEALARALAEHASAQWRELAGRAHTYAVEEALGNTDRRVYQAMEALIHNLNTMNSRAGAQVPFSSINYGTDVSAEGRMVMKNLLLATQAGLGNGETSIFPVQIFKVKEGVNYNPGDPNYDLFKLAMETSAKRLFPNFSFLDAPFNLQYYKNGDYNSEVAYMGCRTRVLGNVHDPERQVTCGRGNLSFTSVNLPRLGLEAHGDVEKFYALLDDKIDLVFRQLLHRLKIQSAKKVRNYPFLMGNGIWLDSGKLDWDDSIGEVLKHGTLTVGFIGLAEALKALLGVHHGESEEAQKLGLEIIGHMRRRADDEAERTGLNFSLIATPAESLSGRFVALDRERYGSIPGVTDRDYYTNSFHVPVYYPIKAFKKIQLEAPYHAMTNAGHITYVELDGDTCKNLQAFERIIRYMHDQGVGYGSINHPLDRDPVCGYTGVIDDVCPRCGRREGEGVSLETLRELRRKFPQTPKWE